MESFEALILARMQFAANITFHILFPTISIALGWFLIFFKTRFLATGHAHWMAAYQFWIKIFALTFAIGAVSGITMSFQFGTNWPGFMNTVGNVAGPLLAYEVLTAFFLEATMLGIMLFGRGRVSEWVHTLATWLVAFGTTASAFWILALDSWMQTPSGFEMIDGKAYVLSWFDVIFNPSFPFRMIHMLLASGLTVAFLVAGLSAFRWLKGDRSQEIQATLRVSVGWPLCSFRFKFWWATCTASTPWRTSLQSWQPWRAFGTRRKVLARCCSPYPMPKPKATITKSLFPSWPRSTSHMTSTAKSRL